MNSDPKYSEFLKQQERMMRRYQGKPEVRKQKAATDKLRLAKLKQTHKKTKRNTKIK